MTIYRDMGQTLIEFTEYHSPDGLALKFDTNTRFLVSEVGYGMPPIRFLDSQSPFQHGKTIYDFRLEPRVIQIVFRENACDRDGYWNNRANVLNILRPNRPVAPSPFSLGTLRKILPSRAMRDIDVSIEQGPEFRAREAGRWDEWAIYETLRFIAPDPTFYDPLTPTATYMTQTTDQLVLPWTFDDTHIIFSGTESGVASLVINYTGTWLSFPIIRLYGPYQNPVVWNLSTNEKIDLSAISIATGETVTIDLTPGLKTVTSSLLGNIIGYVSADSDLAYWHIAPDPEAPGGVNNILVTGSGVVAGASATQVDYKTRYIAI